MKPSTQQQAIRKNTFASLFFGTVESGNMGALFYLMLKELLSELLKNILFPTAAGLSAIQALLSIRQAYLERSQGAVVNAVVNTVAAIGIMTAVIGVMVAQTLFAAAAPIIFTGILAAKSLYHLGASIYYGFKAYVASLAGGDETQVDEYAAKAKGNFIGFLAGGLATVAVGLVMLAGKLVFAILGIASGAIGGAYALSTAHDMVYNSPAPKAVPAPVEPASPATSSSLPDVVSADIAYRGTSTPPNVVIYPSKSTTRGQGVFDHAKLPGDNAPLSPLFVDGFTIPQKRVGG